MSVVIAGRTVVLGDPLYHIGFRAWGTVSGFDVGSAILTIPGSNNQERKLYITNGGLVNGQRVIYWHAPLQIDLPFQNLSKYQAVLDTLTQEFTS